MALLKIIKLSSKTWKHNSDVDGDFILTKFYAKQEDNNFLLVESYGSKRRKYLINEIEVYDIGGSAETFANFSTLFLRLEALSYPAFYEDGVFIFNPNDYISSDSGNTLALGTDNNYFVPSSGGGGSTTFTGLTDTPSTYTGQAGKVATVNATEDALEFTEVSGGGTKQNFVLAQSAFGIFPKGANVWVSQAANTTTPFYINDTTSQTDINLLTPSYSSWVYQVPIDCYVKDIRFYTNGSTSAMLGIIKSNKLFGDVEIIKNIQPSDLITGRYLAEDIAEDVLLSAGDFIHVFGGSTSSGTSTIWCRLSIIFKPV